MAMIPGYTADDYLRSSQQLLPQGLAWRRGNSGTLTAILSAFSLDYGLVNETGDSLLYEMHPQWSTLLLAEWEALLGLPECGKLGQSIAERQDAAGAKWHWHGSLNYKAYEKLAAINGYDVEIVETHPHHCLRGCDYPLYNLEYRWIVEVFVRSKNTIRYFDTTDTANDPLYFGQTSVVECLLNRYKPAHIEFLFYYDDDEDK